MYNLLTTPIVNSRPLGFLTLPGVLAALSRDEIDTYPAMRPHQAMFWQMFCVQLAVMALKDRRDLPQDEDVWRDLLRTMTPEYRDDAPWLLIGSDWTKPAFLQAAVPNNISLKGEVPTSDALDMLITAKNHDLKQAIAMRAAAENWLFALVTLQTGEGYGGRGNQGIVRMNGGSSSRTLVGLAPIETSRSVLPRAGAWFTRDVKILLDNNNKQQNLDFEKAGGLGLTWLAPWLEGDQLQIEELDQFFIEICRRVRLTSCDGHIAAKKGTSKVTRVNAKNFNGAIGDPWTPVHKTENKSLTIGEEGDFDYDQIMKLMFSGDWEQPLLARPGKFENSDSRLTLVTQALARGNCKTGGFRSRMIPVKGKIVMAFGNNDKRQELHEIGKDQAENVKNFRRILGHALAMVVTHGDNVTHENLSKINRVDYKPVKSAQSALDRHADQIFFPFLWRRFEEDNDNAKSDFICDLSETTLAIFERALPTILGGSFMRPKAEARARAVLYGRINKDYGEFLNVKKDDGHVG